MDRKKIIAISFIVAAFLFTLQGCVTPSRRVTDDSSRPLYLKNNIHVQVHEKKDEYRASYANWTNPGKGHLVIPVNTPVNIDYFSRGFAIVIRSTGKPIWFEYDERATNMSADRYINLITSPRRVSLANLSNIDRKGIRDGKAYIGMSKDGVRMALGYPAVHKTPSLGSNTWIYWTNRFRSFAIEFDSHGKVKKIR